MAAEIFGESNFIAQMIWKSKPQGGNDNKYIIAEHEYILVYAKNINFVTVNGKPHTSENTQNKTNILRNVDFMLLLNWTYPHLDTELI